MVQDKKFYIHLVSDSTGETLEGIANAALSQFEGVDVSRHYWPLMRTPMQMKRVIEDIAEQPGLVMYTLVNDEIRSTLESCCSERALPTISVMDPLINLLATYFGTKSAGKPGLQHTMDSEYFNRIEAVQYTMSHDDGQLSHDLKDADIIILGVSRSSKTPTSMYLANKSFRTANIPFVPNCPLPDGFDTITDKFVVGLTTSPDRLAQIRTNRLRSIKEEPETDYTDIDLISEEVLACRRYCNEHGWPVIDVTRRSIEESAVAILHKYFAWKEARKKEKEETA